MKKWLLISTVAVMALVLQACAPKKKAEKDCGFVQNVYGERISWKTGSPVVINIHESVPAQYYPAIEAAIKDWESSSGKVLFKIGAYGVGGPIKPRQDGVNVIYWMDTWEANKTSEQARTSVYWVGSEIKEADIRINHKNFNYYVDEASGSGDVHFSSLLVHELGHVLGLKHKDGQNSVMATYLSSLVKRDVVSTADLSSLSCEY